MHRPDETSAAYHLGLALEARRVTLGDLAGALRMIEPLWPASALGARTAPKLWCQL